ncbi:hypothetical protein IE53DRAFT_137853 [Violaceomyces palustris]|uniref:Uncharacterized protein n=1 Tax=Violaceomyces palustris TaxID=1673888 RepID=A0ACD0NUN8_9BASI|nr:hypothetical protein IE53DRAFT_137853 [Violaceomyces palustris]
MFVVPPFSASKPGGSCLFNSDFQGLERGGHTGILVVPSLDIDVIAFDWVLSLLERHAITQDYQLKFIDRIKDHEPLCGIAVVISFSRRYKRYETVPLNRSIPFPPSALRPSCSFARKIKRSGCRSRLGNPKLDSDRVPGSHPFLRFHTRVSYQNQTG